MHRQWTLVPPRVSALEYWYIRCSKVVLGWKVLPSRASTHERASSAPEHLNEQKPSQNPDPGHNLR
jgi:hypothetical protein